MARGRKPTKRMARGGRAKPSSISRRRRKLQAGGHTHGYQQTGYQEGHAHWLSPGNPMSGSHQHPSSISRPPRPPRGHRRGGKVTHQLRSGGRAKPQPKRMARGGRTNTAPARKMPHGGTTGSPNKGCTMWTGKYDCEDKNCYWDYQGNSCY